MVDEHKVQGEFNCGLMTGLNWPDAWESHGKPGGPWVPSIGYSTDPKWIATCQQAAAERKAWLAGWEEGHNEKIVTNRVNPMRDPEANARHHRELKATEVTE
jgi:hypothetical protein